MSARRPPIALRRQFLGRAPGAFAVSELPVAGASRVGGTVQVQRGAGASISGTRVTGNMRIDAVAGPVLAPANRITGNLQVVGNRGGVTLNANTMGGVMQCQENLPAPTGSGDVVTLKEDQCRGSDR